ncbi:MAG: hypothetical protein KF901_25480 [Myxococcales bacterium]|nr:hypothetical protein [Myxococcales bacterium]
MRTLLASILLLSTLAPTAAQEPPVVEHEFSDADDVRGDVPSTSIEHLRVRRAGRHRSLVRARATFVPELYASVEHL